MKNSILITLLFASLSMNGASLESDILTGKEKIVKASDIKQSVEAVNYFERLASVYSSEWLPLYYAGYACLGAGLKAEEVSEKDKWYEKGLQYLKQTSGMKRNESEALALEGYLKLMYISNKAMQRAPGQTGDAIALLEKAKKMDPGNPRPWFVHGQNTFFTPKFFGGGEGNAKPLLEKAKALYGSFKPENAMMPDWGEKRCDYLLSKIQESE